MGRKLLIDRKSLTALKVKQETNPGKYYDEHGLYLRVKASGAKSWVQKLHIQGKQRELGLGSVSLVSLSEAREAARENQKIARSGGDPIADKNHKISMPNFEQSIEIVHAIHSPGWRNAKHSSQFLTTLTQYVVPVFGYKKLSDINVRDILNALNSIWLEKPETAKRVKQRISLIMKWSIAQGFRIDDPTTNIEQLLPKVAKKVLHRKSLHYGQVSNCLKAIHGSNASEATKHAIELLILTATRSGEIRLARWDEFDFDDALWRIPAERMKTNEEHIIPLSGRAVQIVKQRRSGSESELVFPGSKSGKPISDMTMSKLIKKLGFDADMHGFRTSFRVWVQEQTDTPFEVAEKSLAHKVSNKVTAAYARSDLLDKRRKLMQDWSDYLDNDSGSITKLRDLI